MADTVVNVVETNNPRNAIVRVNILSDGVGTIGLKIWDAAAAANGYIVQGQVLLPGVHTTLIGLDFDVQDMKFRLDWEATADQLLFVSGASPESFDWKDIGGLRVPAALAGATGSIKLSTIGAAANASLSLILHLRKNV